MYQKKPVPVNSKPPGPQTLVLPPDDKNDKLHPQLQYTQSL